MVRQRVTIRFSKNGDLRQIGHRDLMRTIERLLRRAGLPLSLSEGFHPKPRMSFPSALPLGFAGREEVLEIELAEEFTSRRIGDRLAPHLPDGLEIGSIEVLSPGTKKAQLAEATYETPIPMNQRPELAARIVELRQRATRVVKRDEGQTPLELGPDLEELELRDEKLHMKMRATRQRATRPRDVLEALELGDLERQGLFLTRTNVKVER